MVLPPNEKDREEKDEQPLSLKMNRLKDSKKRKNDWY